MFAITDANTSARNATNCHRDFRINLPLQKITAKLFPEIVVQRIRAKHEEAERAEKKRKEEEMAKYEEAERAEKKRKEEEMAKEFQKATGHAKNACKLIDEISRLSTQLRELIKRRGELSGITVLHQTISTCDLPRIEGLLTSGAHIETMDSRGHTPLIAAASNSNRYNTNVCIKLLQKGANVNAKSTSGDSALMFAAYLGNLQLTGTLLAAGADVNAKSKNGSTPLLAAVVKGHIEVAALLIDSKADMSVKNGDGSTPLQLASQYKYEKIVKFLKRKEQRMK